MDNYLAILEDSLLKKIQVLNDISEYNKEQERIFSEDRADLDKFDEYLDRKEELITAVTKLDEGFETLYAKVSEQLVDNRQKYAEQIKRLQELVREVTDKSVSVQAQEARNKALIESYFAKKRSSVKSSRLSSKAAYDYYKSMSASGHSTSQFMDSKN